MEEKKNGVVEKVVEGFKESYQNQKALDKENFQLEKDLAKARHKESTKPNLDFVEFKDTKGLGRKMKVVGKHLKRNARKQQIKNSKAQRERMDIKYAELEAFNKN